MTPEDDFIGQLEGYLDEYEGMTPLPEMARDAVRAQLPTTRQVGPITGPMRYLNMAGRNPTATRYGLLSAVAVAILAVGGIYLVSREDVGDRVTTPYVVGPEKVASLGTNQLTLEVPEGWSDVDGHGVRKNDVSLTVWASPHRVWINPCHWTAGESAGEYADPPMMRSLDYLAEAFWDWWGNPPPIGFGNWAGSTGPTLPRGTAPVDSKVGQFAARYVEFTVPADVDLSACDGGEYRIWTGTHDEIRSISAPGELNRLWVFGVGLAGGEGGFVVIDASSLPSSTSQDLAELQAMVDSIRVAPPTPLRTAIPEALATP